MEFRIVANRVKLYRSTEGRRQQIGSFPASATALEDVPPGTVASLQPEELKQLQAWLKGAPVRLAKQAHADLLRQLDWLLAHPDALNSSQRSELANRLAEAAKRFSLQL
ncbi:hypothetical protein [Novispirillum itersonii]|uniref:Uncharacterized protein n=1 Tax=Novispirillum itersonii TaxID=189 RepID=A0A7X0DNU6_NOVIT|nr:hypothetical protein [Novispirillum itersonii]MBB6212506.1 hypothetical protein [Novispirillum itersonii]